MAPQIRIAAVATLTGPQSSYGMQIVNAVQYAVDELNRTGGLLGREVVLVTRDDEGLPEVAVRCAESLVNDDTALVVGHYLSTCSLAASPIYAAARVVQIAPSTTTPSYTEAAWEKKRRTTFRTCGRDDRQGAFAAQYIDHRFPEGKVAIFHNGLAYGVGLSNIVHTCLKESSNVRLSDPRPLPKTLTELAKITAGLSSAGVDLIYMAGYYNDVAPVLIALRESGYAGEVMSGGANANKRIYEIAGKHSDGLLITCKPDVRGAPYALAAVRALRARGFEPEGYTLSAVAAVEVWAQSVRDCDGVDAEAVSKALRSRVFQSSYGELSFDEKGDVETSQYAVHQWNDGMYREISYA